MKISGYSIETLKVGELKTNCYLIYGPNKKALLIDPGDEADFILRILQQKDLKLSAIIATHGHFDHVLAIGELKISTGCNVGISSADEFLIKGALKSAQHFLSQTPVSLPFKKDVDFSKILKFEFGKISFKVISLPGHTPGCVGFYSKDLEAIFSGDMIFESGGLGRVDFSYSNREVFQKSLRTILKLPQETLVFPGHGEPFLLHDWQKLDIEY